MSEETKQPDLEKCDVCEGENLVVGANELHNVTVKDGKLILGKSIGTEFSKVWCGDCGSDILTENEVIEIAKEYQY
jgi:hypothetical protein